MKQQRKTSTIKTEIVTDQTLSKWLLRRIPALKERYKKKIQIDLEPGEEDVQTYAMFAWVLEPHIKYLLEVGNEKELQRIFNLLEYLANNSHPWVINELRVMMEELDRWKIWKFLGKTMRKWEFEVMTSFPKKSKKWYGVVNINTHIDKTRYESRWKEEIKNIGGFENLTIANELYIRYMLVQEIGITGLRAPKPGGKEWLAWKLPWPWPAKK